MTPADQFDELEDRLRRRAVPALPFELRDRVLADVTSAAEPAPKLNWQLAASLAAAVVLGVNVAALAWSQVVGPILSRTPPPAVVSVSGTDSPLVTPLLGSPWLPCDLPGER